MEGLVWEILLAPQAMMNNQITSMTRKGAQQDSTLTHGRASKSFPVLNCFYTFKDVEVKHATSSSHHQHQHLDHIIL